MTRSTCRACSGPIARDAMGWFHTLLPLNVKGEPDTDCPPCKAVPGGPSTTQQRDLFHELAPAPDLL